jgi:hypothetical protein
LQDATKRETALAATGAGGVEVILASVLNSVLGTRFKNILGYRSSPEMNLAVQRGEAEGRTTTNLRALFAATAGGASAFNVLVQTGLKVAPDYPKVPLLRDLASGPDQKIVLDFISRSMALGRPVATNQNVPAERVAALRKAFDATMKDPEFLAEAKQQDLDISAWTGAELEQVVADIVNTSGPEAARIRQAIEGGLTSEQRREDKK